MRNIDQSNGENAFRIFPTSFDTKLLIGWFYRWRIPNNGSTAIATSEQGPCEPIIKAVTSTITRLLGSENFETFRYIRAKSVNGAEKTERRREKTCFLGFRSPSFTTKEDG